MVFVSFRDKKVIWKGPEPIAVDSSIFLDFHRRILSHEDVLRLLPANKCDSQHNVPDKYVKNNYSKHPATCLRIVQAWR